MLANFVANNRYSVCRRRHIDVGGAGAGAFLGHNHHAGAHGGRHEGGGAAAITPLLPRGAHSPAPAPAPPVMAPTRINVLCVTDSGEVRVEKAVVCTEDYDTFLIVGDRKEKLANAQHATIRDVNGATHEVIVWDDGSFEDGDEDEDEDHSHPVYGLLVPRAIFTVECPVAGNIVITGQGTNIPNGDTTDSENEDPYE